MLRGDSMMLLLLLGLWSSCSAQEPNRTGYETGKLSVSCGYNSTSPVPLVLKLEMEEDHHERVMVMVAPIILQLNTEVPSLQLIPSKKTSDNYSCSVDNMTRHATLIGRTDNALKNVSSFEAGEREWIACHAHNNWTKLEWSIDGEVIVEVKRARMGLDVQVERKGSSFFINFTSVEESGNYSGDDEPTVLKLDATCQWVNSNQTGWEVFVKDRYWIIVVAATSGALLPSTLVGCFVCMKRKRRARKQAQSRFFKVSTASRNLYTDTDIAHKDQDFTYQNVSAPLSKPVGNDHYSDRSSFLSMGGDSYMEPTPGGDDGASDGDCYENTTPDRDDQEGSLDGDCYENTNEEIRNGSEGSQSYEDMKGSVCIKTEAPTDEGITEEEDADSYENMQTPLSCQPNRNPPPKSTEDQPEGTKASLAVPATHQPPWKVSAGLQEQNGDFYISYESKKL